MPELALAAAQPGADLTQATGLGELAEEHCDKMVPAGKALGAAFAAGFLHQPSEAAAVGEGKELAEKAGGGYIHLRSPSLGVWLVIISPRFHSFKEAPSILCFGH